MAECSTGAGGLCGRRRCQLAVQLLLAIVLLSLLVMCVLKAGRHGRRADDCERRQQRMITLPPMPQSDEEMITTLLTHLTLPRDKPCRRELGLGGQPFEFPHGGLSVVGVKWACLDPGLSLSRPDCLVVASRPAREASFDKGAEQFGCQVHAYGPDRRRRLSLSLDHLPGGEQPVSYLALELDGAQLASFLHQPPEALRRVEQISFRLDLTAALTAGTPGGSSSVPGGRDVPLLRRLYSGLLRLQQVGFHPFSSIVVEDAVVLEVPVPGLEEGVGTVREIGWMKVLCED